MPNRKSTHIDWLIEALKSHNSNECLLWPFAATPKGYGHCWFQGHGRRAHRIAFFITYGHWPFPEARHTCDVRLCFNPAHIIEGTHIENVADMVARGRAARGERTAKSRFTPELVRIIRNEYKPWHPERSAAALSRKYGCCRDAIDDIVHRRFWKHVP
jgi:HNH endonuclease